MNEHRYRVYVRNERSGAEVTINLHSSGPEQARGDALIYVFRQFGWRHSSAAKPGQLVTEAMR